MNQNAVKMSKRPFDTNQNKMTRNDRFVQMSQQEMLIEQKKREIQAKLEAKRRQTNQDLKDKTAKPPDDNSSATQVKEATKSGLNLFSNDGSFLDQFKQLNNKKKDPKFKTFNKYKDKVREKEKEKEKDKVEDKLVEVPKSDKDDTELKNTESVDPPGITVVDTSNPPPSLGTTLEPQSNMLVGVITSSPLITFTTNDNPTLTAIGINPSVPPPNTQLAPPPTLIQSQIGIVSQSEVTVSTNVPPPTHLFTTTTGTEQIVTAPPQVLLNVPPPQILPQTQIVLTQQEQNVLVTAPTSILTTVTIPPPVLAPQNVNIVRPAGLSTIELTSIPPPNSSIQLQNLSQPEPLNNMNVPPPTTIQTTTQLQLSDLPSTKPLDLISSEGELLDPNFLKNVPPPNRNLPPPSVSDGHFLANSTQQQGNTQPVTATRIPSLMSQRVLPPPGMAVNVPPPIIHSRDVSKPPPNYSRTGPPPIPNLTVPPPPVCLPPPPPPAFKGDVVTGGAEFEAMSNLARMVAECGPSVEDVVRQKKNRDPDLWFLFHKDSAAYRQYANLVDQYKGEREEKRPSADSIEIKPDLSEIYEPEMALEDEEEEDDADGNALTEIKQEDSSNTEAIRRERKRKSRWGEQDRDVKPPITLPVLVSPLGVLPPVPGSSTMLSKVTKSDPGLLQYAMQTYGSTNMNDEDWKKAEDNYKIHLLYQDMMKKRAELERLQSQGKNKYEYDSDEDTDGGTWEHKLRDKEMQATERWAQELTRQSEGKHHIGDFLPPEEFKRFIEKSTAIKEGRQPNFSDYKEFKIKEDNIGFKMLQKLGWAEGQGLGQNNAGIVEPINKGAPRENTQGLGLNLSEATADEDEYESYRKRMMLAYRFRPNPLNNPRRPYY